MRVQLIGVRPSSLFAILLITNRSTISPGKVAIKLEQRERDNWLVADIPLLRELAPEPNTTDDA